VNPAPPVLLIDGDCAFCQASVRWLDGHGLLGVPAVPWQSVDPAGYGVPRARLATEVVLVRPAGDLLGGARALAHAARAGSSPAARLAGLVDLPPVRPLARTVYRWVARNRSRLPAGTAACAVPRVPPAG
jgi:predicted DCC family thiol-disulfide oxidoreductase YuxK